MNGVVPEQYPLRELALFAGAGGGILGGKLLGWRTVCAVEIEPYCREVLMRRQNEGHLEPFPIWDDVRTFDGRPWNGLVDVVSGGFPCQDISTAGAGAGIEGERSGLWKEFARIIGEVRPHYAFVENSPALVRRGLNTVLGDLAALGYDARWGIVSAADVGLPIMRERIWIVASTTKEHGRVVLRWPNQNSRDMGHDQPLRSHVDRYLETLGESGKQWAAEASGDLPPYLCSLGDGLANELDELRAIGNGQVPIVAATAWRILSGL